MTGSSEFHHGSAGKVAYAGWLVCAALLICVFVAGGRAIAADRPESTSVAALVNGTIITRDQFLREFDRSKRQQGTKAKLGDETTSSELKREALENLITRELLFQESRKRKINVDAGAVDREYKQLKGQFASEGQFTETMKRLKLNETVLREQIAHGIAIRTLINDEIGSKITVSEDEIASHFERHKDSFTQPPQVHLSHILVALDPAATAEQKKAAADKISALKKRLAEGEEFKGLAVRYSDDKLSKEQGGDLGWFVPGQMVPDMEQKVDALKVGEISAIVEDRFGLHLIKVIERKAAFTPPLDELRDKIRGIVKQEKGIKQLQPFVKKLRDDAKVEIVLTGDGV